MPTRRQICEYIRAIFQTVYGLFNGTTEEFHKTISTLATM